MSENSLEQLNHCQLCMRHCGTNRNENSLGFCQMPSRLFIARAALHYWEEPCISGVNGSGTIFFSGCSLRCVFCQNHEIAIGTAGKEISIERLTDIFLELQSKGAHNINLVTPTHYVPQIVSALKTAKTHGLTLPIIYNTGTYETIETLKQLDGLVDIYLPDLKYKSPTLSSRYSHAPNYFEVATKNIEEMYRQVKTPVIKNGLMKRGVIVRHLLLPGKLIDSKMILKYLWETYQDNVYVSILNQYTPLPHVSNYPEINRCVTKSEYHRLVSYAQKLGFFNAYIQTGATASDSFIPPFNYEGV